MNEAPLVSIVIPAYNMEKYLKESIESALAQTYTNLEIIVIDDCSTDTTQKIALDYKDNHVRYYKLNKNSGVANALKTGFELAQGDFLSFLSADDFFIDPDKTTNQVDVMVQTGADWSYYTGYYYGEQLAQKMKYVGTFVPYLQFLNQKIVSDPDLMFMALIFLNPINSASMMVSKSGLQKGGNWDPQWKNADPDGELFLRYCRKKMRCIAIEGQPLFYRIHEHQLSNNHNYMNENMIKIRMNALNSINPSELKHMIKKFRPYLFWYSLNGITQKNPQIIQYIDGVNSCKSS